MYSTNFTCYSLKRYSGIGIRGRERSDDFSIANYDTASILSIRDTKNFIARSKFVQNFLLVIVLLGASLIMSDGLLTPAISVISAVEGITIPAPSLANGLTVPTISRQENFL